MLGIPRTPCSSSKTYIRKTSTLSSWTKIIVLHALFSYGTNSLKLGRPENEKQFMMILQERVDYCFHAFVLCLQTQREEASICRFHYGSHGETPQECPRYAVYLLRYVD